jgi:Adenylate and Guanylate cyclase catalytic domain
MAINYRSHFAYRIDAWDADGENVIEHLAGVEDLQVAKATYLAACQRWPGTPITLRQGPRVIEDSRQTRLLWVRRAADKRDELAAFLSHLAGGSSAVFTIRVGLHSGPVMAGVIGTRRFAYDVWGDSVNIAARLEAASQPSRVFASAATVKGLGSDYSFDGPHKIDIKEDRVLEAFFVSRHPWRQSRVVSFGSLTYAAMLFHSASIAALPFTMPEPGGNAIASSV